MWGHPTLFHREKSIEKTLRQDKYWYYTIEKILEKGKILTIAIEKILIKCIKKSFLINPLTTDNTIYCDSITLKYLS